MISYSALNVWKFSNQFMNYSDRRIDREKRTSPLNLAWKILLEWTIAFQVLVIFHKYLFVGLCYRIMKSAQIIRMIAQMKKINHELLTQVSYRIRIEG